MSDEIKVSELPAASHINNGDLLMIVQGQANKKISAAIFNSGNDTRITAVEADIDNLQSANEYSTTENVVGKWIDGRPLYRKVINFGTLPNITSKIVSTGLNVSEVTLVKLEGLATGISTGGDSYLLTLPDINPAGPDQATRLSGNSENGIWRVIIQTGVDRTNYSAYISVYYTKTADSAS